MLAYAATGSAAGAGVVSAWAAGRGHIAIGKDTLAEKRIVPNNDADIYAQLSSHATIGV
jgi:hypothetical protein